LRFPKYKKMIRKLEKLFYSFQPQVDNKKNFLQLYLFSHPSESIISIFFILITQIITILIYFQMLDFIYCIFENKKMTIRSNFFFTSTFNFLFFYILSHHQQNSTKTLFVPKLPLKILIRIQVSSDLMS